MVRPASYGGRWAAIVAGGSSGIGYASARRLVEAGAEVVLGGIDEREVSSAVEALASEGATVHGFSGDLSQPDAAIHLIEVGARDAPLRVLVNSVGIQRYGTAEETSVELWDQVQRVNVRTAFLLAKFAIPEMRSGGGGAIVNVASVQAFATQASVVAYTSSKAALVGLTRALAVDHARDNIRANVVCPGSVRTPMLESAAALFAPAGEADQLMAKWGAMHPMGRVADADEVAEAVWFLASPQSSFITGSELKVDGGLLAAIGVPLED
jgi:NAD(P)-dependent dehydrogenase (short-subunit alcohol dehydrogenase family)